MAETNEKKLTQPIEKIKKSMKANRLSGFYLFANDWHPTHNDGEVIDWGQGEFGVSFVEKYDPRASCTETFYIRKIKMIGDKLLFSIEELYENSKGTRLTLSYYADRTLEELLRIPNQTTTYNVGRTLMGIANHYINNPDLIAASKVANFDPKRYCEFEK